MACGCLKNFPTKPWLRGIGTTENLRKNWNILIMLFWNHVEEMADALWCLFLWLILLTAKRKCRVS